MIDNKLSKFPGGSIREILHIAFPLMVASFSFHFMLVIDRAILAKYSVHAFNAASVISMSVLVFQFMAINITSMAEVLAGQYYGSKKFNMVARPIWQMIYFSLSLLIPFMLIGYFAGDLFVSERFGAEGKEYFLLMMGFAVIPAINTALASFFVARGKTFIISVSAVIANVLNIAIAYPLILGIDGIIAPMGLIGSAYAAMISFSVQVVIMMFFFLTKKNIAEFDALNLKIDFSIIKRCLKVGVPNAVSHGVELLAYATTLRYLAELSDEHVTVSAIAQNFFILIVFFSESIQKSVIAVASNAIGSKSLETIAIAIKSAIKVMFGGAVLAGIPFLLFPESMISIFISDLNDDVLKLATIALIGSLMFFLVDGLAWVFAAVLTSGGDTKFIMVVNITNSWLATALIVFFVHADTSPVIPWLIMLPGYVALNTIAFMLRYRYGKWKTNLTKD